MSSPSVPAVRPPEPSTELVRPGRTWAFRGAIVFAALLPLLWGVASAASAFAGGPHVVHELLGAVVLLVVLLVQAALLVGLHPYRREAWWSFAIDRPLLSIVAVQAVPLVVYAIAQGRLQSSGDAHAALAHYFDQAWLAFLIVAFGLVSAVRADLRRLAGQLAGVAVTAGGLVGIVWPDLASSPGRGWGAAAVLAGLATVITARRATRPS